MTYKSPFYELPYWNPAYDLNLEYNGTLEQVLADLSTSGERTDWALQPARVIRAVVDYKVQHPDCPKVELLLRDAINFGLAAYSNPSVTNRYAVELREQIKDKGLEELLSRPLHQPSDHATSSAMHPARSRYTAEQLVEQVQSKDVLFIALAHGGVAAGMDVYLRYCDLSQSQDSAFYVARLSTQKYHDTEPKLSSGERKRLRALAKRRQVVIFDEDTCTGHTISIADTYFSVLFPKQQVILACNIGTPKTGQVSSQPKIKVDLYDNYFEGPFIDSDKHNRFCDISNFPKNPLELVKKNFDKPNNISNINLYETSLAKILINNPHLKFKVTHKYRLW